MNVSTEFDYLIIGAGPAGLQLAYFLEKAGYNYLVLEAGDTPGTFFKKFPRHRKLISINKVYTGYSNPEVNLRWDWNSLICDNEALSFKHYSREYFPHTDDLVRYLNDFADYYQLNIKCNTRVVKVSKSDKFVVIDHQDTVYSAKRLIVATGFSKPYVPEVPGIELAENYTEISTNPEDYANQRVLILGKGNSGFETADSLVGTTALLHIASPNPISMAWKTKYVGHLRAVNNNLLDTYQLKSQNVALDATVKEIRREDGQFVVTFAYTHANGEEEDLVYDRVIVCTGFQFDDAIFDGSCKPELTIHDRFPAQTSDWESTNIQDLYFVGVLTHMRDFKKKQSGFIHGFRYNIKALFQILAQKYNHQSIPYQTVAPTPADLAKAILERINITSGLWQQTGFLCDLLVLPESSSTLGAAQYYQDIPIDYVRDSELGQHAHYYTITLEFGLDVINASADPFAINRVNKDDVANAAGSGALHPIIRRYCGDTLVCEYHIIEDIMGEWLEQVHIEPLLIFLSEQLTLAVQDQDLKQDAISLETDLAYLSACRDVANLARFRATTRKEPDLAQPLLIGR
ncbi:MAG: NAD(P)-binding domain-containing protein [Cyanobacteria bacterium J06635_15]